MLEEIYKTKSSIKRLLNAPLLEDRLRYLRYRKEQGAADSVIRTVATYQLVLIEYLGLEKKWMIPFEEIKAAAHRWSLHQMRYFYSRFSRKLSYHCGWLRFIKHARNWLGFLGRLEMAAPPPVPQQVSEYVAYMRKEMNLSGSAISHRCMTLRRFFSHTNPPAASFLAKLTPAYLDEFLIQKLRGIYAWSTLQTFISDLRLFLRYAEARGWCRSGIADSLRTPRIYKHATLPSGPSWKDVSRLLKTTEGNRPCDIRARAVLLLLAVYGLRQSEICQLRLEDIDWEGRVFLLRHSKEGPMRQFPLVPTVKEALVCYIKKARPHSHHREVFLTLHAPFRPVRCFYDLVAKRLKSLNIAVKHSGPHSLRHACATRLINQGVSLKTIADQLGHRSLDSTRIYAKVDLPRLREVADFDMGGLS